MRCVVGLMGSSTAMTCSVLVRPSVDHAAMRAPCLPRLFSGIARRESCWFRPTTEAQRASRLLLASAELSPAASASLAVANPWRARTLASGRPRCVIGGGKFVSNSPLRRLQHKRCSTRCYLAALHLTQQVKVFHHQHIVTQGEGTAICHHRRQCHSRAAQQLGCGCSRG